ncbi:ATP-binding protein [Pseudomonas sp. NPDC086251]|uniref:ATP-binding protein n=1 Tax=Pseudomonas sp. NPDC086251 TaxID=3364431 RepID=UPI00383267A4
MNDAHVEAVYTPTGLSHYDGNPLIEALPRIYTDEEVVNLIRNYPPLPTRGELLLPAKVRAHCISRVDTAVLPLDMHLRFEGAFGQLLRHGYTARNPFSRDTVAMQHASTEEQLKHSGFKSSANTLTVIGLSGMGKTTMLNAIVKMYPQVIFHHSYNGKPIKSPQVVWLKIECPHDGSPRGLCASFFAALDQALGTNYTDKFIKVRNSISVLMQRVSQMCRTYHVGVLIIDEMQNLNSAPEGSDKQKLLNFFVALSNDAGVPLVLSGTNATFKLFSRVVRNARRALGMGEFYFDRFTADDPEWQFLVEFLWGYSWADSTVALDQGLQSKIFDLTQGNTDFLVKLFTLAQRHAVCEGAPVTGELLQYVYDTQMTILHKPIEALRSGDPDQVNDFEDMMPAKDQVALMMCADLQRRVRRVDRSLLLHRTTAETLSPPAASIPKPVKAKVASVPPVDTKSKARKIVESDDWEEAMKGPEAIGKPSIKLW